MLVEPILDDLDFGGDGACSRSSTAWAARR